MLLNLFGIIETTKFHKTKYPRFKQTLHNGNPFTEYISMEKNNLYERHSNNKKILLFDIDGTLYKISDEFKKVDMNGYKTAFEKLNTTNKKFADFVADPCFLQKIYDELGVTPIEVERAKGDIKYENYIERNEKLIIILKKTPYRLWCFTNGLKCRASRILKKLEIEHLFEGIICTDDNSRCPVKKPYVESYEFVEKLLGVKDTKLIYFFDDLERNIKIARERGWNVIEIKPEDNIVTKIEEICE
ncbi:hypothetical protein NGRA_1676 [Nosema granulosis]|uniref:Pyrimidine 5-nucleotidase n=1 Tax=Nosema granulosis TaxID=83296 RepID=A0A9P6GY12_9MICR|nr:hypothetical protein NGRA_1676 [Nosema granulosis]